MRVTPVIIVITGGRGGGEGRGGGCFGGIFSLISKLHYTLIFII